MTVLLWLRRDLRRADHPALRAAVDDAGEGGVLPVFVLDPGLWDAAGDARREWLGATLAATAARFDDALVLRLGDPVEQIPALAQEVGADAVHVTAETTPFGRRRDAAVARRLAEAGVAWRETGTPYAVPPGSVRNGNGKPYRVFTPFRSAWWRHGWEQPHPSPRGVTWASADPHPEAVRRVEEAATAYAGRDRLPAGEEAARRRWRAFVADHLLDYDEGRDRPDLDVTSRMSPYLKLGVVHPRTLLHDVAPLVHEHDGARDLASELAWREFYADVVHHHPRSLWSDLTDGLRAMRYDEPVEDIEAWRQGRTGFPIVDAGMRQLLAEGWMHNRVRMITASFLTKDLHVWWPTGARHFLDHLIDGDVASNNHGWQWVAGTGTDAAPYFRVFNPITQGRRFDPSGAYVRRWVPELRHLDGPAAHAPWEADDGYAHGYPEPILDHAVERREALARYEATR